MGSIGKIGTRVDREIVVVCCLDDNRLLVGILHLSADRIELGAQSCFVERLSVLQILRCVLQKRLIDLKQHPHVVGGGLPAAP